MKKWFDDWKIEYGPKKDKYYFHLELPNSHAEKEITIEGYMSEENYNKIKNILISLDTALTELTKTK